MKNFPDQSAKVRTFFSATSLGHGMIFIFTVITFLEILIFYANTVANHAIVVNNKINLIYWQYELPFSISRAWDILLSPLYLVTIGFVITGDFFNKHKEHRYELNRFGQITIGILLLSMSIGLIFGAIYAPISIMLMILALAIITIICLTVSLLIILCVFWGWKYDHRHSNYH